MKKLILLLLMTASSMANDLVMIQSALNAYNTQFDSYNQTLLTTSAGLTAISNIDFNPNHQGLSAGIGFATAESDFGDGDAIAFGLQYGYENVAINVKGAFNNNNNYLIGSGIVISF